ncbi:MAG: HAMP domain-containing histidine kinase [Desulfobacteraceae bacterium]|nr:HAMP domain-containing histidine kinase [Desulfobacteraceae bacterium]
MMNIKFSIKTKFFIIILIPALLLLFVIYLNTVHLGSLGRSAELILSKNYKSIQVAQQIRQLLEVNRNRILMTLFQDRATVQQNIPLNRNISSLLKICKDNITEPGEKQIIDNLFEKHKKYDPLLYDLLKNNQNSIGYTQRHYEYLSLTASLITDLNNLVLINEKAMEAAEEQTRQIAKKGLRYSVGLLFAAILFSIIFSYILSSKVSQPLTKLARSLAEIKEGEGEYPQISVTSHDEIGFLISEFNRLFERFEIYDQLSADKLTAQKLKVRQAEEAKGLFVADLSHQLKTPMTSLSMSVGVLSEKANSLSEEKKRTLLKTAREDCFRLSALINELVDIAKLEGLIRPRRKELLSIENVIHECLRPLINQAEEKKIYLKIDIESELPPISIDSFRFPWVITNLIGNAIRYTDQGGRVALKVDKHGRRFYFQCIDSGSGIEEKYLPKIFDRFTQFSEREKSGAIGLGLAIVKEIIEQHGGDITVESKIGKGTTFTFWIPLGGEEIR